MLCLLKLDLEVTGSSLGTFSGEERLTLGQTGNSELYQLDLAGDANFNDAGELNDDQTFNVTNELTDRDTDGGSPHTLDERRYFCQNWRGDVVNILTDTGHQVESVRYSPYGVPHLLVV